MKRFIVAILSVIYLGNSVGATVYLHFCMGRFVNWSLSPAKSDRCSKCGMKKTKSGNGCCKDEHKQVKIEKDQKIVEGFHSLRNLTEAVPQPISIYSFSSPSFLSVYLANHMLHRSRNTPVYILNCIFRI